MSETWTDHNGDVQEKNEHRELPGKGVLFWEHDSKRQHAKWPDYKGFIVLEMDYKAGEKLKLSAWQKETRSGYTLLSLSEDNWNKKQQGQPVPRQMREPTEVRPTYKPKGKRRDIDDDDDLPF